MNSHEQLGDDLTYNQDGQQYLSFLLEDEEYGIDILRVQELRGWAPVTPIPEMPDYLRGVLNLRGAIIPVIDLRLRFGLPALEYGPTTVVIVINVQNEKGERVMGIIVDAVAETYTLANDQIQVSPQIGGVINSEFITGLVAQDEKMIVLMDIDQLMNSGELAVADSIAS